MHVLVLQSFINKKTSIAPYGGNAMDVRGGKVILLAGIVRGAVEITNTFTLLAHADLTKPFKVALGGNGQVIFQEVRLSCWIISRQNSDKPELSGFFTSFQKT